LMFFSIFLLASIVSYSPSDPNFIYSPENVNIKNIGENEYLDHHYFNEFLKNIKSKTFATY